MRIFLTAASARVDRTRNLPARLYCQTVSVHTFAASILVIILGHDKTAVVETRIAVS